MHTYWSPDIRWNIWTGCQHKRDILKDDPATHWNLLHALIQASLGHLTLNEASGQATNVRWDILKANDPATHCMYNSEGSTEISNSLHAYIQALLGHLTLDEASERAANIRWDILKDDPGTHCIYHSKGSTDILNSLHAHIQASLGHLTLGEASGQAANVIWDILKDDAATHCMHHSEGSTEIQNSLYAHIL